MNYNVKRRVVWFAISILFLTVDILSKKWAVSVLKPLGTMPLIDGLIGLRYSENTGAAFSSFSGATVLLSGFSLTVCAAIFVYMIARQSISSLMGFPLSLVLAGGVGNLIDRIGRGYVIDFFELQFMKFAIFNVADICITTGCILLFAAILFGGEANGRMESRK